MLVTQLVRIDACGMSDVREDVPATALTEAWTRDSLSKRLVHFEHVNFVHAKDGLQFVVT